MALALLVLPGSVLSRGWTQEMLVRSQELTGLALVLTGAAGFWRGRRLLAPPSVRAVAAARAAKPARRT